MIAAVALLGFAVGGLGGAVRLVWGPTLADRVAALDVALLSLMGAVVVDAVDRHSTEHLDLLVVIAIVGFTATTAASRFLAEGETEVER